MPWLATAAFLPWRTSFEVLCGMLGPLAAASVSWVLAERKYRQHPQALTKLMMLAFGAKLIFFAAYVTVMLRVLLLRPGPFIIGFTVCFIVLHLIEALFLRRLFRRGMETSC